MTRPARRALSAAGFLALAALGPGCAPRPTEPAPARPAPRVVVETASGARHPVRVEVARTDAERARGLMFRERLDADAGMIFLFEETAEHGFWMKNTLIPLDLVFIDEGGVIVAIERAEPGSLESRTGGVESRYVLEVNGGWCAERGVARGDRVRFENVLY